MGASQSAEHWLLLRGLARENAHWDDFPQRFAGALGDVRVHLLDLPGNGEHWAMSSPTKLEDTLAFVRERALPTLPEGTQLWLFAMSLGAMVAIDWMQRYPQEIAGAVLVNTSLGGFCPFYRRLCWRAWPLLLRIATCANLMQRERLILALTTRRCVPTDALLASRVDTYRRHPVRAINVLRQLAAAARFRPAQQAPASPLLLLNALGDRMVDPGCTAVLAQRWGAELKTHPSAGHDLPLDDPEWTVAQVRAWWMKWKAAR